MRFGLRRKGAGRNPNFGNNRSLEAIAQAEGGGEMPLDFLLSIMNDEGVPTATRIEVAIICLPYCHPKLAPKQQTDAPGITHEQAVKAMLEMKSRIGEQGSGGALLATPSTEGSNQPQPGEIGWPTLGRARV
jgi:hypothetical protein